MCATRSLRVPPSYALVALKKTHGFIHAVGGNSEGGDGDFIIYSSLATLQQLQSGNILILIKNVKLFPQFASYFSPLSQSFTTKKIILMTWNLLAVYRLIHHHHQYLPSVYWHNKYNYKMFY